MDSVSSSTSANLRLVRAYGAQRPAQPPASTHGTPARIAGGVTLELTSRPSGDLEAKSAVRPIPASESGRASGVTKLVAGVVPEETGGALPAPASTASAAAIPFYRHPADQNAAYTSATAGRILDLNA